VPLEFLKRQGKRDQALQPAPVVEDIEGEEFSLRLNFAAKSSDGVRMAARPGAIDDLPSMLVELAESPVEVVEPLPIEFGTASPIIERPEEAMAWLNARHHLSPITRHALVVLERLDALDPAFDTFACALLDGELDTSGYPTFSAIVGGVASHWDEATGELIVRAMVGWGGKGVRGDTDRVAGKLLSRIFANVVANRHALGLAPIDRPVPAAGAGGLVCAHCGFSSAHARAFYCPKCGMRLLRG
jgi:hypothetical protein